MRPVSRLDDTIVLGRTVGNVRAAKLAARREPLQRCAHLGRLDYQQGAIQAHERLREPVRAIGVWCSLRTSVRA